jgi:predicted O-methyltransferase YrrM
MIEKIKNTLKEGGIKGLWKKIDLFLKEKQEKYFYIFFKALPDGLQLFLAKKIHRFQSNDINKTVEYSFDVLQGLIRPMQIPSEFEGFLHIFRERAPKTIVEIGTANGGSLFSLCKLAPDNAFIISIDLPAGEFGGGYPAWKTKIYSLFKKDTQKLLLLREDSHTTETFEKLKMILKGTPIDFLFIDGDHSYEGVKKDFEMYSPLVVPGGMITLHDVTPSGLPQFTGGVPAFWKEIKNKYQYKEFIRDEKQTGFGIGCLFLNK